MSDSSGSSYQRLIVVWIVLGVGLLLMSSFLADDSTLARLTPNAAEDSAGAEPAAEEDGDEQAAADEGDDGGVGEEDSAEPENGDDAQENEVSEEGGESDEETTEG